MMKKMGISDTRAVSAKRTEVEESAVRGWRWSGRRFRNTMSTREIKPNRRDGEPPRCDILREGRSKGGGGLG